MIIPPADFTELFKAVRLTAEKAVFGKIGVWYKLLLMGPRKYRHLETDPVPLNLYMIVSSRMPIED